MFEIIALMKPVQLNESSVSDAMDTPNQEFRNKQLQDLLKFYFIRFFKKMSSLGIRIQNLVA